MRRKNKNPKLCVNQRFCIPRLHFSRLVRELQVQLNGKDMMWQSTAIVALQEAAEAFIERFFEDATVLTFCARRVTLQIKDIEGILYIYYSHKLLE